MKYHYCFLEKFNNYFNRKIIKYDDLDDYLSASSDYYIPTDSEGNAQFFDFIPNDNVTTEIIVNDIEFIPDYFLLYDSDNTIIERWFIVEQRRNRQGQWTIYLRRDVIADNLDTLYDAPIFVEKGMLPEDDPFIVNSEGMSLNQVKKNEIKLLDKSKTAWIVGYMAKNIGGADVNIQAPNEDIKFSYHTLADIASAMGTTEGVLASFLNFGNDETNKAYFTESFNIKMYVNFASGSTYTYTAFNYQFSSDFSSGSGSIGSAGTSQPYLFVGSLGEDQSLVTNLFKQSVINNRASLNYEIANIMQKSYLLTDAQLQILYQYNGTYVRYNGEYYKLSISESGTNTSTVSNIKNDNSYSSIAYIANDTVSLASGVVTLSTGTYSSTYPNAYVLKEITSNEKEVVVSLKYLSSSDAIPTLDTVISSGRNITADQEFDIFAIPLNMNIVYSGGSFETIEAYSRRIASAIGIEEDAKVYDLQLLPYCPVPDFITDENEIDITGLTEHEQYDLITKNQSDTMSYDVDVDNIVYTLISTGYYSASVTVSLSGLGGATPVVEEIKIDGYPTPAGFIRFEISNIASSVNGSDVTITFNISTNDISTLKPLYLYLYYHFASASIPCGIIFYVGSSSFSTVIDESITSSLSKKIISNCYMWRLVSPNYQGAFEFNIAKNGGSVTSFNVFCTYKPFTPFIKVAPNFTWLYGAEYQDNRGLICAGDFSLPRATDAWINYQLNNKNYQNIFNRDIQHLDFMQSIEMRNQLVSGAMEIFADTAKGAGAGLMAGGPYGAIAGAVIGGGASAIGYGIDVDTLARTQRENRQLAIDKFNYQLGNIKALPYTLTKVGSFDIVSKIFPFIEEYSCTDNELTAFENKIKYDSMTVMRIGTLREFANFNNEINYFKGSLIRNDDIADDPHTLNAIYEELLKGVYI